MHYRHTFFLVITLFFVLLDYSSAQETAVKSFKGAESSTLIYLGKSRPLGESDIIPISDESKMERVKRNKFRMVPNFLTRKVAARINDAALPIGADPVRQSSTSVNRSTDDIAFSSIEGIDQFTAGAGVPDTDGAVGKNHYVQVVNASYYQVFDKEGNALVDPLPMNTLWAQFGVSSGGDPIILYDQEAERWIITEFGPPFGQNQMLIAISETDNPLGVYNAYQFLTVQFPDYPKYAIWDDAYLITSNEGGTSTLSFYALDKNAMLAGEQDVSLQRFEAPGVTNVPGFFTLTPLNWSGDNRPDPETKPMLWRMNDDGWGSTPEDRLEYFQIDRIDWDNPGNSTFSGPYPVIVAPFDSDPCSIFEPFSFACVPQPSDQGIDAIPQVIMNQMHYRNFSTHESIVLNFVVDATGSNIAGIRWMELRKNDDRWTVYQEGTYAPSDGLNRFMGGIAIDGAGNIAMGFNVSGPSKEPSLRFTGRQAGDPLGEMTIPEQEFATGTGSANTARYGDYANMVVDPEDNRTFWFTGEYQKAGSFWGTDILSFSLRRDTNDLGVTQLFNPEDDPELESNETVTIEVKNFGLNTQNTFDLGLIVDGNLVVVDQVEATLETDETYTHTFSAGIDMSDVGFYQLECFVLLSDDDNSSNDTLPIPVRHIPDLDVTLARLAAANGENFVCGDTALFSLNLLNNGRDTLKSLSIAYTVNGTSTDTVGWSGSLAFDQTENISLEIGPLTDGPNILAVEVFGPNGLEDELKDDNIDTLVIESDLAGKGISFILSLDDFPAETTWLLEDSKGNQLFSGGPYEGLIGETITELWCLNPDSCYTLRLLDAFGDGIAGNFVKGDYQIIDEAGRPITELKDPNFGFEDRNSFCARFTCRLGAELELTPASTPSATNGAVIISAINAGNPAEYSLDGEQFSGNGFFGGLGVGTYTYFVRDAYGCLYTDSFTIASCNLTVDANITGVSQVGASDGQIEVLVENANGSLRYSLNNGVNFQASNTFSNLMEGSYNILVRDEAGCSGFLPGVEVGVATFTTDIDAAQIVRVHPNPSNGVYQVEIEGLSGKAYLDYTVSNNLGVIIGRGRIGRYNSTYKGPISIINEASGLYYLKFDHPELGQAYRLVKE